MKEAPSKGKEKVSAETWLMFTAYNIRRAISLAGGVQNLMQRMAFLRPFPKEQRIDLQF